MQAVIASNVPKYQPERWHSTLIYYGIIIFALLASTYGAKLFPLLEKLVLCLHLGFFVVIIAVLAAKAPKHPASFVFTTWLNLTGWENRGVVWCIGTASITFVFAGESS